MGKFIDLKAADGFTFPAYVAEAQGKAKGAMVVLQEIFGVNSHIQDVVNRFAAQGYFTIAPALFEVNVFGAILCAREAIKRMSTRYPGGEGGAIVNVSSAAARIGSPGQYVDYAAAKGAIDTFTIGLAKEVASEGIRVNAVRQSVKCPC